MTTCKFRVTRDYETVERATVKELRRETNGEKDRKHSA